LLAQTATYLATTRATVAGWFVAGLSLISAGCLLVGFMTPVIAIVVTLGAAALALLGLIQSIEIVVLAIAIALLGPGAISLDARMFGRREILLPHTHHIHRGPQA
jgi:hypothetical protein